MSYRGLVPWLDPLRLLWSFSFLYFCLRFSSISWIYFSVCSKLPSTACWLFFQRFDLFQITNSKSCWISFLREKKGEPRPHRLSTSLRFSSFAPFSKRSKRQWNKSCGCVPPISVLQHVAPLLRNSRKAEMSFPSMREGLGLARKFLPGEVHWNCVAVFQNPR